MTSYKASLSTLKVERRQELPASRLMNIFLNYQLSGISSVFQTLPTGLSPLEISQSISPKTKQT